MTNDFVSYARKKLQAHNVQYEPAQMIQKLTEESKINANMTNETKYKILLIKLSAHKLCKNMLENKEVIYDIHIELPAKTDSSTVEQKIRKKLAYRVVDVYVTKYNNKMHLYINLDLQNAYKPETGYEEVMCYSLPYVLIYNALKGNFVFDDFVYNEILLEKREFDIDRKAYSEIANSLQSAKTPVTITSIETTDSYATKTAIHNEIHNIELSIDDKKVWPSTTEERRLTKGLYYTMLYSKNKYKSWIAEDWLMLNYKTRYYKVTARLTDDIMSNRQMVAKAMQKRIKAKTELFRYNIMAVKQYLAAHGFYPLIYDDLYVNVLCCMLHREDISPGAFFRMFLQYDIVNTSMTYNVETNECTTNNDMEFVAKTSQCYYVMPKIDRVFAERLAALKTKTIEVKTKLYNANFDLMTKKLLVPCLEDFDFVLSKNLVLGFDPVNNKQDADFVLGKPLFLGYDAIFADLTQYAYFFYSPTAEMLYCKQKTDFDQNILISIILSRTAFDYVKINNK